MIMSGVTRESTRDLGGGIVQAGGEIGLVMVLCLISCCNTYASVQQE